MSCGARDNVNEISTSFITQTNFKRTVICSYSKAVKLQPYLSSYHHKISLFASAVVWHQHFYCCTFCCSCLVLCVIWANDWAASNLGSCDGLIMVDKGNAKGLSWGGCVGKGRFTKTLHKIFLMTPLVLKKKKILNQCCFSIFLPLCVILAFAELDRFWTRNTKPQYL